MKIIYWLMWAGTSQSFNINPKIYKAIYRGCSISCTTRSSVENDFYSQTKFGTEVKPSAHDIYTGRDPARVKIFDTTLRDGEQSPGFTMNAEEKLAIAKQLSKLGVDIIEAGFPIASPDDFSAVRKIADVIGNSENPPIICGLARAVPKDITTCYDAVKYAKFPRIHIFLATSDIHMQYKLKKSRDEVLQITSETVKLAASLCQDVEFSAEDALRSDPTFLYEVYSRAIEAGASTINVPDTVGYTTPSEFYNLIRGIRENVRGIDGVTISVHGHDDLGLSVANFLAAIEGGARQVECTINGIGERAGNAALEELVMALHVRKSFYNKHFNRPADSDIPLTNINTREIFKTSRLVSTVTGMTVQANKAIVGANAFAHESGIHQDGVLKNKRTYEIMDADLVGVSDNSIVLGKHSGRHAFRSRLNDLGFNLNDDELNRAFLRFKDLADKKKEISNLDIEALVNDEMLSEKEERYKLVKLQVVCGDQQVPTAVTTVRDELNNGEVTSCTIGTGPVDAVFKAIAMSIPFSNDFKLLEYSVSSVTGGIDALADVSVRVQDNTNGRVAVGRCANSDVILASAQSYVNALNRLLSMKGTSSSGLPWAYDWA